MRGYIIIIAILSTSYLKLLGQDQVEPIPEQLHVHLDRNMYILGENVWYKLYCVQPESEILSKPAYVDLLDPEGNVVSHQILDIKDQYAWGNIALNTSWVQGYYTIRAYTRLLLNYPEESRFQQLIPVYHPGDTLFTDSKPWPKSQSAEEFDLSEHPLSLTVKIASNPIGPRQKISLELEVKDEQGKAVSAHLSVSVRNLADHSLQPHMAAISNRTTDFANSNNVYKPETQLMLYAQPEIEASSILGQELLQVPVTKRIFYEVQDNILEAKLEDYYGLQSYQWVIDEGNTFEVESVKAIETHTLWPGEKETKELPMNEEIAEAISRSYKRRLIKNLFSLRSQANRQEFSSEYEMPEPEIFLKASDYISFPKLRDFIPEVVYMRYQNKEGDPHLELFDRTANIYYRQAPLCLVNGVAIADVEAVLELPWQEIESISFYLSQGISRSRFGALGENGVMSVKTRYADITNRLIAGSPSFKVRGYHLPGEFVIPDYSDNDESGDHVPDMRDLIYWNPAVKTEGNGKTQISFFHSDDEGEFEIYIEGIDKNGNYGIGRAIYSVKSGR